MATEQTIKVFTEREWEERKSKARNEIGYMAIRPYSHNSVGLCMSDMNDEQMKKFATELELGKLGWESLDTYGKISDYDKRKNELAIELMIYRRRLIDEKPSDGED